MHSKIALNFKFLILLTCLYLIKDILSCLTKTIQNYTKKSLVNFKKYCILIFFQSNLEERNILNYASTNSQQKLLFFSDLLKWPHQSGCSHINPVPSNLEKWRTVNCYHECLFQKLMRDCRAIPSTTIKKTELDKKDTEKWETEAWIVKDKVGDTLNDHAKKL